MVAALIIFTSFLFIDAVLNLIIWRGQIKTRRAIAGFIKISQALGFLPSDKEIRAAAKR